MSEVKRAAWRGVGCVALGAVVASLVTLVLPWWCGLCVGGCVANGLMAVLD